MKRVIFEFETDDIARGFLAFMSDGGGECGFFDADGIDISRFDYSMAFEAWGYDPEKHGSDYTVKVT